MVLLAKVRLSMLLGPARILVFLSVLCRFLLPLKRGLARLYCRIILARVTLARRGNNGRVNDLSAHRQITLGLRSEEHTSELQSLMRISYAVFCLKKKNY